MTKRHPTRYGRGPRRPAYKRRYKLEVGTWALTEAKQMRVARSIGGREVGVSKVLQVAVMTAIAAHRGWDHENKTPTSACPTASISAIAKLLGASRDQVRAAVRALEVQGIIVRDRWGWDFPVSSARFKARTPKSSPEAATQPPREVVDEPPNGQPQMTDQPSDGRPIPPSSSRGRSEESSPPSSSLRSASVVENEPACAAAANPPSETPGGSAPSTPAAAAQAGDAEAQVGSQVEKRIRDLMELILCGGFEENPSDSHFKFKTEESFTQVQTKMLFEGAGTKSKAIGLRWSIYPGCVDIEFVPSKKGLHGANEGRRFPWARVLEAAGMLSEKLGCEVTCWEVLVAMEAQLLSWRNKEIRVPAAWVTSLLVTDIIDNKQGLELPGALLGFRYPSRRKKTNKPAGAPAPSPSPSAQAQVRRQEAPPVREGKFAGRVEVEQMLERERERASPGVDWEARHRARLQQEADDIAAAVAEACG